MRLLSNAILRRLESASMSMSSVFPSPSTPSLFMPIPSSSVSCKLGTPDRPTPTANGYLRPPTAHNAGERLPQVPAQAQGKYPGRARRGAACDSAVQVQTPSPPAACRPAGITKRQHSQKTDMHRIVTHLNKGHVQSLDHALLCLIVSGIAAWTTLGSSARSGKEPLRRVRHLDIDLRIPHPASRSATCDQGRVRRKWSPSPSRSCMACYLACIEA